MPNPVWMTRAGYALSGLVTLFLVFDAALKLFAFEAVRDASGRLGWPAEAIVPIGVTLLISTLIYVHPKSAVLGAVLLTGYLGGAVATHARLGNPLFSHVLFGVYLGVLIWGGLYLRMPALRALFPWRRG